VAPMLRTTGSAQLSAAAVRRRGAGDTAGRCRGALDVMPPVQPPFVFGLFPLWSTLRCGLIVVVRRQVGGGQPREVAGKAAGVRLVC